MNSEKTKKMNYMQEEFQAYGFYFSKEQLEQFYQFYEMLIEKNKVMNLTSIIEFEEVVEKHFIDSLLLSNVVDCDQECRVIDMGTGAGFPGIPLKIAFPKLKLLLMDSLNKRIVFLKDVIDQLGLIQIEAVHARAEEFTRQVQIREQFDYCVSRAVANLATLEEYCLPFVKIGGQFISYKSSEIEEEIKNAKVACKRLGGELNSTVLFTLYKSDAKRTFVVIDKVKKTPKAFPRKAGTPAKEPLHE